MAAETEDKGYRVEDKRFFRPDEGEPKAEAGAEAPKAETKGGPEPVREAAPPREEARGPEEAKKAPGQAERKTPLPPITFSAFIFSLNSSALYHLGEYPDPETGERVKDLELAKQTIDLLGLLQEKTAGNLAEDESRLLEALLYDLRMRYVKESG
jgi:hypothetical protein